MCGCSLVTIKSPLFLPHIFPCVPALIMNELGWSCSLWSSAGFQLSGVHTLATLCGLNSCSDFEPLSHSTGSAFSCTPSGHAPLLVESLTELTGRQLWVVLFGLFYMYPIIFASGIL